MSFHVGVKKRTPNVTGIGALSQREAGARLDEGCPRGSTGNAAVPQIPVEITTRECGGYAQNVRRCWPSAARREGHEHITANSARKPTASPTAHHPVLVSGPWKSLSRRDRSSFSTLFIAHAPARLALASPCPEFPRESKENA
jgi:hypothetical protein